MMDGPLPEGLTEEVARVCREDPDPPGLDSYSAVFESPLMYPLQRRAELEVMMRLARGIGAKTAVAIGVDKAGDPYHWLKCLSLEWFVGIEIRGIPYGEILSQAFPATRCLWLPWSSYDDATVVQVTEWLSGHLIDCLFVDGDKAEFYRDFECYLPIVRRGGVVFMHDIRDEAPRLAFERARQHARVRESTTIEDVSEVAPALERERAGLPPVTPHEGWLRHWRGRSCGVGVLWV